VLLFYKFNNIIYVTIQRIIKRVKSFGTNCFSFFHSIKRIGRKPLLENQSIFRYSFFKRGLIKRFITYHFSHRDDFSILKSLTILKILSIINIFHR